MATRLPPADSWDTQTGVHPVTDFQVECTWIPINVDWALVRPIIRLHDGIYSLAKDAEVLRVYRDTRSGKVESPELSAFAWTKKVLGSGGVSVLAMYEQNPGHITEPGTDGGLVFRWHARVGSRLSVAVVRLDGNLAGQARLTPVE